MAWECGWWLVGTASLITAASPPSRHGCYDNNVSFSRKGSRSTQQSHRLPAFLRNRSPHTPYTCNATLTLTPPPQVVVELAHKEGLVLPAQQGGKLRALVSSLLLRLDALASSSLLTNEQFQVLRNKAWAQDFGLVRAYDTVGGPVGRVCTAWNGFGVGNCWLRMMLRIKKRAWIAEQRACPTGGLTAVPPCLPAHPNRCLPPACPHLLLLTAAR